MRYTCRSCGAFFPFIHFGQQVGDRQSATIRGLLLDGASLRDWELLWASLATLVWVGAIAAHRRTWRFVEERHRSWKSETEGRGLEPA